MLHQTQRTPLPRCARTLASATLVLPVWRSPKISSRCPRPIGNSASIALIPVWSGVLTGARARIGGAGRSIGRRFWARSGSPPSRGSPSGETTRPSSSGPTGTSATRRVRLTRAPAVTRSTRSRSTTPTVSLRRSLAMPTAPPAKRSRSSTWAPGRPRTSAIPPETDSTVPSSSTRRPGPTSCRAASSASRSSSRTRPGSSPRASVSAPTGSALTFGLPRLFAAVPLLVAVAAHLPHDVVERRLQLVGPALRRPADLQAADPERDAHAQVGIDLEARVDLPLQRLPNGGGRLLARLDRRLERRRDHGGRALEPAAQRTQRVGLDVREALAEHAHRLPLQARVGQLGQGAAKLVDEQLGAAPTKPLARLAQVAAERVGVRLAGLLRFLLDLLDAALAQRLGLLLDLLEPLAALPLELVALVAKRFRLGAGLAARLLGRRLLLGDAALARLHGALDGAVEEDPQQRQQDHEVDDLRDQRERVEGHGRLPRRGGVPERVREDQDERHDEAVDRGRLDHGQAHEQRARAGVRLVGLLRDALQRLRQRACLAQRRTDRADGHREAGDQDRGGRDQGSVGHSDPPSPFRASLCACRVVPDAMYTIARIAKM